MSDPERERLVRAVEEAQRELDGELGLYEVLAVRYDLALKKNALARYDATHPKPEERNDAN